MDRLIFWSMLLLWSSSASGAHVPPGMETRITQSGLDFVRNVAVKKMESMVIGKSLPDQSGSSTFYSYEAHDMYISSFSVPTLNVYVKDVTSTGVGLQVYAVANVAVSGRYEVWIVGIHRSGTLRATINSARLSMLLSLNTTNGDHGQGVPLIQYNQCSFDSGSVSVYLSDHSRWDDDAAGKVANALDEQTCSQIASMIKGRLRQMMLEQTMKQPFYQGILELDYSFLTQPSSINGSIGMKHKGEVYAANYPRMTSLPVPYIPQDRSCVSKMFYVWITDFLFNSAGCAAHDRRLLRYTLSQKDVPPRMSLNTSQFPINVMFPQVASMYPKMMMQFTVYSAVPPQVNTTKAKMTSYVYGYIDAAVTLRNNSVKYLFTLSSNLSMSFNLGMKRQNVTWIAMFESVTLDLVKSTISGLKIDKLKMFLQPAMKNYVIPELNRRGQIGYPLPGFEEFSLMNTNITQGDGFLKVGTDVSCGQLFTGLFTLHQGAHNHYVPTKFKSK